MISVKEKINYFKQQVYEKSLKKQQKSKESFFN